MAKQVTIKNPVLALLLGATVMAQVACAQPGGGQGARRGPPPEAYEACADLAAGDSCTMTGRRGDTLEGSCIVPSEDESSVVCAPEGGPGDERDSGRSGQ
ncbi:MAG: hypothetical protein RJQ10_03245 [Haliea sp.]|uniref:hypothetical protein n=1 Tax=Haliea sp. TaxID=1932666 RepID=UPI0032EB9D3D